MNKIIPELFVHMDVFATCIIDMLPWIQSYMNSLHTWRCLQDVLLFLVMLLNSYMTYMHHWMWLHGAALEAMCLFVSEPCCERPLICGQPCQICWVVSSLPWTSQIDSIFEIVLCLLMVWQLNSWEISWHWSMDGWHVTLLLGLVCCAAGEAWQSMVYFWLNVFSLDTWGSHWLCPKISWHSSYATYLPLMFVYIPEEIGAGSGMEDGPRTLCNSWVVSHTRRFWDNVSWHTIWEISNMSCLDTWRCLQCVCARI